jgi:DNA (cytosine-5)-methyltransferase 1
MTRQLLLDVHHELIIDNFAGGGGASCGIETALGRSVDIAINHDPEAVAMHRANHPQTEHHCESVWEVDPRQVTQGRPVGVVWLSPDCKHFSKAKGGKPVEKKIRGLAWVALRWAATVRPRVIMLENVEEFVTWGPLAAGPDGELRPCPKRKGREFQAFVNALRRQGYQVEWRELRACDFGAPTIRKRLFLIARCDGASIVWPTPSHGDPKSEAVRSKRLKPWRTAAECIDWSLPCPSIFERERPLAEATCRRIARGIMRYVVGAANPFIVPITHQGDDRAYPKQEPLRTVTAAQRGEFALVQPTLVEIGYGERDGQAPRAPGLERPLGTVVAGGIKHALVSAFLVKHYGGVVGTDIGNPISTVTAVDHHSLVTTHLMVNTTGHSGASAESPLPTITTGGHFAEVRAFLIAYYGVDQDPRLDDPMHTVTSKHRFGLVTVAGQDYAIADIGLRMLAPRELYTAQGFPAAYVIGDRPADGLTLTKTAQVRMCGNSVSPPVAAALVRANLQDMAIRRAA